MSKILSILVSFDGKEGFFNKQINNLAKQIKENGLKEKVQFLTCTDNSITVGARLNKLMAKANGSWVMVLKETDVLSDWALKNIIELLEKENPDMVSVMGMLRKDGTAPKMFVNSLKNQAVVDAGILMMPPCQRNPMRATLAKKCRFDEVNVEEDVNYISQLLKTGIKTEAAIDKAYLMVTAN